MKFWKFVTHLQNSRLEAGEWARFVQLGEFQSE
ncbi:MAG: hypothetical protein JWP08_88, partial [Bryobacterales bacterium]|nr:hypothetical protein [Bryobacterales bacterium]